MSLREKLRRDAGSTPLFGCFCGTQECGEIREQVQKVVEDMDLDEARTIFSTE